MLRLPAVLLLLAAACAAAPPVRDPAPRPDGLVLREAELARVRCLVLAPLESGSDAPRAAAAATAALAGAVDQGRTRLLPPDDLRALFDGTPLELPEGLSASSALELAELLGADAALYGALEGRSRETDPDLVLTLRLTLAGQRDLLFAASAHLRPAPGERVEAAARRTALELARPVLARLGAPGRHACFGVERREALRAAAVALGQGATAAPPAPAPAPVVRPPAPPAGAAPSARALRTQRQRDWARALGAGGRLLLEEVTFEGRSAALARDAGLADLAVVLAASPGLTLRLEGFVDASGDAAADLRLSAAMAQAAAQRLLDLGVEASRVGMAGRGSTSPRLPSFTARGRAANRRVEVVAPR
ncbi:MAG: OmpA family protein [Anaeromyxobacter sp.]|nr:OmpA family protein [Anaeromyxobacter sp.]MBL0275552.1 OmpA family protein [Anaeromyxobacter sp.]